jgi:signal transduction histidine kinase
MADMRTGFDELAAHLEQRREAILSAWRKAIKRDPALTGGNALPRAQLIDHIPAVLAAFEQQLRDALPGQPARSAGQEDTSAAAHGLHRWQQGYDLREVIRELGLLNETMVAELDAFAASSAGVSSDIMAGARRIWAVKCTVDIEESATQYFHLKRLEAAGHVKDLEAALQDLGDLERQRAELWMQVAHDLKGNVAVVVTATHGLGRKNAPEEMRDKLLVMLERNVKSLRHLLDDVTSLTKLQAGGELRQLASFDAASLMTELCEGLQALALQRNLYLHTQGPATLVVEGDALKIRRIAQNLILNAIKYTHRGGVTVAWSFAEGEQEKRWILSVSDTGPGFQAGPGAPLAGALKDATQLTHAVDASEATGEPVTPVSATALARPATENPVVHQEPGEGIGLSIVKRLCEMLDASLEVESDAATGTRFRVLAPSAYTD